MAVLSRSTQKEIMDDMSIRDDRLDVALRELQVINRMLGGNATTRKGIRTLLRGGGTSEPLSILDVGAGGGDVTLSVVKLIPETKITAFDLNERVCTYASQAHPRLTVVQGSVFDLPFREASFDIVHASLFLHHFTEEELLRIVPSLVAQARVGLVINDLRRSALAYIGIWLLTRLFSRSQMVKNDGPLSVKRGFTKRELLRICRNVPSGSVTIRRTWAFRWLVCIRKKG